MISNRSDEDPHGGFILALTILMILTFVMGLAGVVAALVVT
ncbi:MAG TPA: hypothetical protein VM261_29620 [Kofleriaceae bacterium]|nr:hypothetical protein [Kofleriaceae bacterium]